MRANLPEYWFDNVVIVQRGYFNTLSFTIAITAHIPSAKKCYLFFLSVSIKFLTLPGVKRQHSVNCHQIESWLPVCTIAKQ